MTGQLNINSKISKKPKTKPRSSRSLKKAENPTETERGLRWVVLMFNIFPFVVLISFILKFNNRLCFAYLWPQLDFSAKK